MSLTPKGQDASSEIFNEMIYISLALTISNYFFDVLLSFLCSLLTISKIGILTI